MTALRDAPPRTRVLLTRRVAAGLVASRYAEGRAVTIAVEGMKFHRPVIIGDEVSVYAEMLRIGLPVRVAFETVKEGLTLPYLVPGEPA